MDKEKKDKRRTYSILMWTFIANKLKIPFGARIDHVVEIGSRQGHWVVGLLDSFDVQKLFAIDLWPRARRFVSHCGEWLEKLGDRAFKNAFPLRGDSGEWAKVLPVEPIDLLFIDGNHKKHFVINDLNFWYHRVRPGGLILMHDAFEAQNDRGVMDAANEFFADKPEGPQVCYVGPTKKIPSLWIVKGESDGPAAV